jgi:hypothetical protein
MPSVIANPADVGRYVNGSQSYTELTAPQIDFYRMGLAVGWIFTKKRRQGQGF